MFSIKVLMLVDMKKNSVENLIRKKTKIHNNKKKALVVFAQIA